jgi:hypothetical protein
LGAEGLQATWTLQPPALLLRGAAPHAVALAVLQAHDRHSSRIGHTAQNASAARLLFGDREENVGLDAETRGSLLPEIRGRGCSGSDATSTSGNRSILN